MDMVQYVVSEAGIKPTPSQHYIEKVARKRSSEALARIVDFLQNGLVSAQFAYSVMTSGIYE